jgi:hypothetical protein
MFRSSAAIAACCFTIVLALASALPADVRCAAAAAASPLSAINASACLPAGFARSQAGAPPAPHRDAPGRQATDLPPPVDGLRFDGLLKALGRASPAARRDVASAPFCRTSSPSLCDSGGSGERCPFSATPARCRDVASTPLDRTSPPSSCDSGGSGERCPFSASAGPGRAAFVGQPPRAGNESLRRYDGPRKARGKDLPPAGIVAPSSFATYFGELISLSDALCFLVSPLFSCAPPAAASDTDMALPLPVRPDLVHTPPLLVVAPAAAFALSAAATAIDAVFALSSLPCLLSSPRGLVEFERCWLAPRSVSCETSLANESLCRSSHRPVTARRNASAQPGECPAASTGAASELRFFSLSLFSVIAEAGWLNHLLMSLVVVAFVVPSAIALLASAQFVAAGTKPTTPSRPQYIPRRGRRPDLAATAFAFAQIAESSSSGCSCQRFASQFGRGAAPTSSSRVTTPTTALESFVAVALVAISLNGLFSPVVRCLAPLTLLFPARSLPPALKAARSLLAAVFFEVVLSALCSMPWWAWAVGVATTALTSARAAWWVWKEVRTIAAGHKQCVISPWQSAKCTLDVLGEFLTAAAFEFATSSIFLATAVDQRVTAALLEHAPNVAGVIICTAAASVTGPAATCTVVAAGAGAIAIHAATVTRDSSSIFAGCKYAARSTWTVLAFACGCSPALRLAAFEAAAALPSALNSTFAMPAAECSALVVMARAAAACVVVITWLLYAAAVAIHGPLSASWWFARLIIALPAHASAAVVATVITGVGKLWTLSAALARTVDDNTDRCPRCDSRRRSTNLWFGLRIVILLMCLTAGGLPNVDRRTGGSSARPSDFFHLPRAFSGPTPMPTDPFEHPPSAWPPMGTVLMERLRVCDKSMWSPCGRGRPRCRRRSSRYMARGIQLRSSHPLSRRSHHFDPAITSPIGRACKALAVAKFSRLVREGIERNPGHPTDEADAAAPTSPSIPQDSPRSSSQNADPVQADTTTPLRHHRNTAQPSTAQSADPVQSDTSTPLRHHRNAAQQPTTQNADPVQLDTTTPLRRHQNSAQPSTTIPDPAATTHSDAAPTASPRRLSNAARNRTSTTVVDAAQQPPSPAPSTPHFALQFTCPAPDCPATRSTTGNACIVKHLQTHQRKGFIFPEAFFDKHWPLEQKHMQGIMMCRNPDCQGCTALAKLPTIWFNATHRSELCEGCRGGSHVNLGGTTARRYDAWKEETEKAIGNPSQFQSQAIPSMHDIYFVKINNNLHLSTTAAQEVSKQMGILLSNMASPKTSAPAATGMFRVLAILEKVVFAPTGRAGEGKEPDAVTIARRTNCVVTAPGAAFEALKATEAKRVAKAQAASPPAPKTWDQTKARVLELLDHNFFARAFRTFTPSAIHPLTDSVMKTLREQHPAQAPPTLDNIIKRCNDTANENAALRAAATGFPPPKRHPYTQRDLLSTPAVVVTGKMMEDVVKSFSRESSAGPSSLDINKLRRLLEHDVSGRLMTGLTEFFQKIVRGGAEGDGWEEIFRFLCAADLVPLIKQDGVGVRPIAVTTTFRRIAGKIVTMRGRELMRDYFSGLQFGCAVPDGIGIIAHWVAEQTRGWHDPSSPGAGMVLLKVDIKNAFNTINREAFLAQVFLIYPDAFRYAWRTYGGSAPLFVRGRGVTEVLQSTDGGQQGDPFMSACFSLGIHPILLKLRARFNNNVASRWYLDDGNVIATPKEAFLYLMALTDELKKIGLKVNFAKCELYGPKALTGPVAYTDEQGVQHLWPTEMVRGSTNFTVLGVPFGDRDFLQQYINNITDQRNSPVLEKLTMLGNSQAAHSLMRMCLGFPAFVHIMRNVDPAVVIDAYLRLDMKMMCAMECVLGTALDEPARLQLALPIRDGGFAITSTAMIAAAAFIACALSASSQGIDRHGARAAWNQVVARAGDAGKGLVVDKKPKQRELSHLIQDECKRNLIALLKRTDEARLGIFHVVAHATTIFTTGSQCRPSGVAFSNAQFSILARFCLGLGVALEDFICPQCQHPSDRLGTHAFTCTGGSTADNIARHNALRDALGNFARRCGLPIRFEVAIDQWSSERPGDIVVRILSSNPEEAAISISLCVDVTVTSPLSKTNTGATRSGDVDASIRKQRNIKEASHKRSCEARGYEFLAFVFSPLGGYTAGGPEADFIKRLAAAYSAHTGHPTSETVQYVRRDLAATTAKGTATSMLARVPGENKQWLKSDMSEISFAEAFMDINGCALSAKPGSSGLTERRMLTDDEREEVYINRNVAAHTQVMFATPGGSRCSTPTNTIRNNNTDFVLFPGTFVGPQDAAQMAHAPRPATPHTNTPPPTMFTAAQTAQLPTSGSAPPPHAAQSIASTSSTGADAANGVNTDGTAAASNDSQHPCGAAAAPGNACFRSSSPCAKPTAVSPGQQGTTDSGSSPGPAGPSAQTTASDAGAAQSRPPNVVPAPPFGATSADSRPAFAPSASSAFQQSNVSVHPTYVPHSSNVQRPPTPQSDAPPSTLFADTQTEQRTSSDSAPPSHSAPTSPQGPPSGGAAAPQGASTDAATAASDTAQCPTAATAGNAAAGSAGPHRHRGPAFEYVLGQPRTNSSSAAPATGDSGFKAPSAAGSPVQQQSNNAGPPPGPPGPSAQAQVSTADSVPSRPSNDGHMPPPTSSVPCSAGAAPAASGSPAQQQQCQQPDPSSLPGMKPMMMSAAELRAATTAEARTPFYTPTQALFADYPGTYSRVTKHDGDVDGGEKYGFGGDDDEHEESANSIPELYQHVPTSGFENPLTDGRTLTCAGSSCAVIVREIVRRAVIDPNRLPNALRDITVLTTVEAVERLIVFSGVRPDVGNRAAAYNALDIMEGIIKNSSSLAGAAPIANVPSADGLPLRFIARPTPFIRYDNPEMAELYSGIFRPSASVVPVRSPELLRTGERVAATIEAVVFAERQHFKTLVLDERTNTYVLFDDDKPPTRGLSIDYATSGGSRTIEFMLMRMQKAPPMRNGEPVRKSHMNHAAALPADIPRPATDAPPSATPAPSASTSARLPAGSARGQARAPVAPSGNVYVARKQLIDDDETPTSQDSACGNIGHERVPAQTTSTNAAPSSTTSSGASRPPATARTPVEAPTPHRKPTARATVSGATFPGEAEEIDHDYDDDTPRSSTASSRSATPARRKYVFSPETLERMRVRREAKVAQPPSASQGPIPATQSQQSQSHATSQQSPSDAAPQQSQPYATSQQPSSNGTSQQSPPVVTSRKPQPYATSQQPQSNTTPKQQHASTTSQQSPSDATSQQSSSDASSKLPQSNTTPKQSPSDATSQQSSSDASSKQPQSSTSSQQSSSAATSQQSPSDASSQQSSSDATSKQPQSSTTSQQSPSDATSQQSSSDASSKQPQSSTTSKQSPSAATSQQSPSNAKSKLPQSNTTSQQSSSDASSKLPQSNTTPKQSPSDATSQQSSSDASSKLPQANTTPKQSSSAATSKQSSSDATSKQPQSSTTSQQSPSAATSQQSPSDATSQQSPSDATSQQSPSGATSQQSSSDASSKLPQSNTTSKQQQSDATPQQSPSDATSLQSPSDATSQQSSSDATSQQQQSSTSSQQSPPDAASQHSPSDATSHQPQSISTSRQPNDTSQHAHTPSTSDSGGSDARDEASELDLGSLGGATQMTWPTESTSGNGSQQDGSSSALDIATLTVSSTGTLTQEQAKASPASPDKPPAPTAGTPPQHRSAAEARAAATRAATAARGLARRAARMQSEQSQVQTASSASAETQDHASASPASADESAQQQQHQQQHPQQHRDLSAHDSPHLHEATQFTAEDPAHFIPGLLQMPWMPEVVMRRSNRQCNPVPGAECVSGPFRSPDKPRDADGKRRARSPVAFDPLSDMPQPSSSEENNQLATHYQPSPCEPIFSSNDIVTTTDTTTAATANTTAAIDTTTAAIDTTTAATDTTTAATDTTTAVIDTTTAATDTTTAAIVTTAPRKSATRKKSKSASDGSNKRTSGKRVGSAPGKSHEVTTKPRSADQSKSKPPSKRVSATPIAIKPRSIFCKICDGASQLLAAISHSVRRFASPSKGRRAVERRAARDQPSPQVSVPVVSQAPLPEQSFEQPPGWTSDPAVTGSSQPAESSSTRRRNKRRGVPRDTAASLPDQPLPRPSEPLRRQREDETQVLPSSQALDSSASQPHGAAVHATEQTSDPARNSAPPDLVVDGSSELPTSRQNGDNTGDDDDDARSNRGRPR